MALVYRGNRVYRYRSVRRNGKVTSEYRGSGELAEFFELLEAEDRAERAKRRAAERVEREAVEAEEADLIGYFGQVEDLTRAALVAAGFHQHRHQWRKRRGQET